MSSTDLLILAALWGWGYRHTLPCPMPYFYVACEDLNSDPCAWAAGTSWAESCPEGFDLGLLLGYTDPGEGRESYVYFFPKSSWNICLETIQELSVQKFSSWYVTDLDIFQGVPWALIHILGLQQKWGVWANLKYSISNGLPANSWHCLRNTEIGAGIVPELLFL